MMQISKIGLAFLLHILAVFGLNLHKFACRTAVSPKQIIKNVVRATTAVLIPLNLQLSPSQASWFPSNEQRMVDQISICQKPVQDLLDQLRPMEIPNAIGVYSQTQLLRGGKEDSAVVQNYLDTYIKPCQQRMEKASSILETTSEEDKQGLHNLPLLMKGHILELQQAIQSEKASEQEKEVEEVRETLADFLKIASRKYEFQPYAPNRPLTEKDIFGPLGCEFWGKSRIPGSNKCEDRN